MKRTFEIIAAGEIKPDRLSRMIQFAIGENYSHSAILVDGKDIYHATEKGVHIVALSDFMRGTVIRHRIAFDLVDEEAAYAMGWLDGMLDTEYSESQYIGFFWMWLYEKTKWKWTKQRAMRWANNGRAVVCSEFTSMFGRRCLKWKSKPLVVCDFINPKIVTEVAYAEREQR